MTVDLALADDLELVIVQVATIRDVCTQVERMRAVCDAEKEWLRLRSGERGNFGRAADDLAQAVDELSEKS